MRIGRETLAVYTFFLTEPFKLHFSFALTSNSNVYVASAVILMENKYVISSSFSNAIYENNAQIYFSYPLFAHVRMFFE